MTSSRQGGVQAPRLNPFAFPSDTDFRFVLLIVSVIGASALLYSMLYDTLPLTAGYKLAEYERCVDWARAAHPGRSLADLVGRMEVHGDCTTVADAVQAGWMLAGMALVLGLALGIYLTFPARKLRSERLEPLSAEDSSEALVCLAELCREAGLSHPPAFVWDPLDSSTGGVAFGRLGRYYVALGGGLVTQFYTDRAAFRAVVLHELAHLHNGDVDKAYLTIAVWQAFLVVALAPFAVGQLVFARSPLDIAHLSWRLFPLAALAYLMRNAVLHARELDADVRASTWDGSAALGRLLEALPRPAGGSWRSLLSVHPNPCERRLALDETDRLLRMGFWDAFGTGCAAGIALPNVVALLNLVLSIDTLVLGSLLTALLLAAIAVGMVGVGVWRTTFVALARGEPPQGAGRLGLGLGLGLLLGQKLSFADAAYWQYFPSPIDYAPPPVEYGVVVELLWGSLLLASMFFFLRWIAAGASTWLEVSAGESSPRDAYQLGLMIAGALLAVWLGALYFVYLAFSGLTREGTVLAQSLSETVQSPNVAQAAPSDLMRMGIVHLSIGHLVALLMLISLWALPLAAWLRRGRVAAEAGASWAFLDHTSGPLRLPPQTPLRPDLALRTGLVTGAGFCAGSLLLLGVLRLSISAPGFESLTADSEASAAGRLEGTAASLMVLWILAGQFALAVLLQIAVAVIVAARVPRLGGLHGLFAACVAACLMAPSILGIPILFSFWPPADFWVNWMIVDAVMTFGPLLALPPAVVASAIAGRLRRRAPSSARPELGPAQCGLTQERGPVGRWLRGQLH